MNGHTNVVQPHKGTRFGHPRKGILIHATAGAMLEDTVLGDISQSQRHMYDSTSVRHLGSPSS